MSATTIPAQWIELLIEKAPKLREAGVSELAIGDVKVSLRPHNPPLPAAEPEHREPVDPLDDPLTFGRTLGLPGYAALRDREDD